MKLLHQQFVATRLEAGLPEKLQFRVIVQARVTWWAWKKRLVGEAQWPGRGTADDYWVWDTVHPTYRGHQLLADEWERVVREYWK